MKKNIVAIAAVAILFAGAGIYFGARAPIGQAPAAASATPALPTTAATAATAPGTATPAVASLFAQSFTDASGAPQSLAQWKGRPMVVNFWATWCGPCVQEMPELSALQTEMAPKKVQIVGIGIDSPTNIREFAAKYRIAYPLYVAGMGGTELARGFGNQAGSLPYTVLVAADGRIAKTYLGKLKMDELRRDIAAL